MCRQPRSRDPQLLGVHLGPGALKKLTPAGENTREWLAEVAATAPEVVRGIQQGLIQEVVDFNADAIGASYRVAVTPDPRAGSCEVGLVLSPKN